jgi:hypothetical protein
MDLRNKMEKSGNIPKVRRFWKKEAAIPGRKNIMKVILQPGKGFLLPV